MTTKEGNVNFDGEGIDYDKGEREYGGYVDLDLYEKGEKGNMKKVDPKTRIDKLEKCIRNKDKRIKKIEEYFWIRNRVIVSIPWSLLFVIPWALLLLYGERTPENYPTTIPVLIFSIVGAGTCILGSFYIWMCGIEKLWEKP